jgi:polysaccharide export outer membrane protein
LAIRPWASILAVALVVIAPLGGSAAQEPPPTPATQAPQTTTAPPTARREPAGYRIAPGDVLHIMVWNEPSLSTDVPVPLLGDLQAAGRTPDELTVEIRTSLKRFLEVPQVTVSVAQAVSARFYVIGEVTTSGSFALTGRITILQALAIAGGFREFAHRERIMVIRDGQDGRVAITFNYRDLESGIKLEQDIPLAPGDIIIVP